VRLGFSDFSHFSFDFAEAWISECESPFFRLEKKIKKIKRVIIGLIRTQLPQTQTLYFRVGFTSRVKNCQPYDKPLLYFDPIVILRAASILGDKRMTQGWYVALLLLETALGLVCCWVPNCEIDLNTTHSLSILS